MTAKRKLWISITAVILVLSLLASILLVFADEAVPSVVPTLSPAYTPAPTPVTTGQPFTQPGNGTVEDHVEDGTGSKEFYTVQTGNGNTFYLVIDKDRLDDNAYLLSQVTEDDLLEFTKDSQPEETPALVIEETPAPTEKPETPKKTHHGLWTILLLLLLGGAAALWYFRMYLPNEEEPTVTPSEHMETVTEGDTIPMEPEDFPEEDETEPLPEEEPPAPEEDDVPPVEIIGGTDDKKGGQDHGQ